MRSRLLKKKLKSHIDDSSGDSVSSWNVAGVVKEGFITRRTKDYNDKKARNNRIEILLEDLKKNEIILHSFVGYLYISGNIPNKTLDNIRWNEGEPKNPLKSGKFVAGYSAFIVTDRRILFNSSSDEGYHHGTVHNHLNFGHIIEVFYAADSHIQIHSEDRILHFHASNHSSNEIYDVARSIATSAGLNVKYDVEDTIESNVDSVDSTSIHTPPQLEIGWGSKKRTWDNDKEKDSERSSNKPEESEKAQQMEESRMAHNEAKKQDPPVNKGDIVDIGVLEINYHHSGEREGFGKYYGFNIHIKQVPDDVEKGDVITVKIMDFASDYNSATGLHID